MRTRLLAIQGPLQFITGYIAFDWYRHITVRSEQDQSVLLMYDFLSPPDVEHEIADAVMQLSASSKWLKIVFIRGSEMTSLTKGRFVKSIDRLHELLGFSSFDEIFLARDHVGHGSPLIVNAYPTSTKIAYGDSFGLVGQRSVLGGQQRTVSLRSLLSPIRRRVLEKMWGAPRIIPFDAAVLTLPLDLSGTFLAKVPLIVPPRDHVMRCMDSFIDSLTSFASYCQGLLRSTAGSVGDLYLLSNLTASGLTTRDCEVELYVDVINKNSPLKSTVLLKHHPRSQSEVLAAVVSRLERSHRVVVLDDKTYTRIPVELWRDLISECRIVPIFSTSSINLKYLYGKNVFLPLNAELIRRFFLPAQVSYGDFVDRLIRESIANLDAWDGKSALWAGSP